MQVYPVSAFKDNYVWIIQGEERRVAIVDPGEAAPVLEAIERENTEPVAILVTHHHADHVGGIAEIRDRFPVPVFGPAHESVPGMDHPLREGDRVEPEGLGLAFEVLDTPGHTAGHIAYVHREALFCGDTLFTGGCGKLFEGTPRQMFESLEKIRALPESTWVYCGHEYTLDNLDFARQVEPDSDAIARRITGDRERRDADRPTVPATLELERATNPFLRWDVPAVREAAEAYVDGRLRQDWEVFAALRQWKDDIDAAG